MSLVNLIYNLWEADPDNKDAQRLLFDAANSTRPSPSSEEALALLAEAPVDLDEYVHRGLLVSWCDRAARNAWERGEESIEAVQAMMRDANVPLFVRLAGFVYGEAIGEMCIMELAAQAPPAAARAMAQNAEKFSADSVELVFAGGQGYNPLSDQALLRHPEFALKIVSDPTRWKREHVFYACSASGVPERCIRAAWDMVGLDGLVYLEVEAFSAIGSFRLLSPQTTDLMCQVLDAHTDVRKEGWLQEAVQAAQQYTDGLDDAVPGEVRPLVLEYLWQQADTLVQQKHAAYVMHTVEPTQELWQLAYEVLYKACAGDMDVIDKALADVYWYSNSYVPDWYSGFPRLGVTAHLRLKHMTSVDRAYSNLDFVEEEDRVRFVQVALDMWSADEISVDDLLFFIDHTGLSEEQIVDVPVSLLDAVLMRSYVPEVVRRNAGALAAKLNTVASGDGSVLRTWAAVLAAHEDTAKVQTLLDTSQAVQV